MSNENFEQRLARYEGHVETLPKDRNGEIPLSTFNSIENIPLRGTPNTKVVVTNKTPGKYGLYYDSVGKLTSGIGHLIKQGENIEDHYKLTKAKALKKFKVDITKHKQALEKVSKNIGVDLNRLNSFQKESLISMMFNTNLGKRRRDGSLFWKGMWGALKKATSGTVPEEEKEKYLALAGYEMLNSKRFTQVKSRAVEEADVFFPKILPKIKWDKENRNIIRDIKEDRKSIYNTLKEDLEANPVIIQPAPMGGYKDRQQEKIDNIMLNISPEDTVRFGRQPGRLYAKVQERNDEEIVGKEIKREQETEGNQQTTQRIS